MIRPQFSLGEWCVLLLATSLYVGSFFLPAIVAGANLATEPNVSIIAQGPILGVDAFKDTWRYSQGTWWANPCAWLALVLAVFGRRRTAAVLATLGCLIALVVIGVGPISWRFGILGTGYWTWTASMALLAGFYAQIWYASRSKPPVVANPPSTEAP